MRPLEVVNAAVGIESPLLLEVVGGWFNFALERAVESLEATVLLGSSRGDAFECDAKAKEPDAEA